PADLLGTTDMRRLLGAVARYTFSIEAVGALGLWAAFSRTLGPVDAIWPAVFHAVGAFCNAGLSTFTTSLEGYARDPAVLLITAALIVLGSLGYLSGLELLRWWRAGGLRGRHRLSIHTWAATVTTLVLI